MTMRPLQRKIKKLTSLLSEQMDKGAELDAVIRGKLEGGVV